MNEIKCPKCESVNVISPVFATGRAYVDMRTGELVEQPDDCDYDFSDIDEFICDDCAHAWRGKPEEDISDVWFKNREKQERERHEKIFGPIGPIGPATPAECHGKKGAIRRKISLH